jgi:hypothetical protein
VLEEGKLDTIAVLGLDGDPSWAAIDPEAESLSENGVRRGDQSAVDYGVVLDVWRKLRLKAHCVEQPIVAKVDFADVDAVIERRDEEEKGEETPQRAAAATAPPASYHWDWAPSTMLVTSLSSAFLRPSASWPGS